jgi:hypothetical protein
LALKYGTCNIRQTDNETPDDFTGSDTVTFFQLISDRRFKEYIPDNPFTGFGFFLSWNETDV